MKERIDKDIDISRLLALSMGDSLSDEERYKLESWVNSEKSRQLLLQNLQNAKELSKRNDIIARINLDQEWNRLQMAIKEKPKVRRLFWANFLKYTAIIILPLLIGIYLVLQVKNQSDFIADVSVEIKPGVKKAQLVLSNGEKVELGEENLNLSRLESGVQIENKNKVLNYETIGRLKGELRYNYLLIGRGEEYQLTFSDGTKVWLNSESKLKYPTQFANNIREVELEGEGYFEVSKNKNTPFVVKTEQMNIEVLGTSFNISAYQDDKQMKATLVEGSVRILPNYGTEVPKIIKPDEQAIFNTATNKVEIKKVDAQAYGRWREGVFAFDEDSLEEIMIKLSRWYKIRVFYQDADVRNYQFSGKLPKFESCNEILEMIEKTTNVQFEIKNRENVIVSKR